MELLQKLVYKIECSKLSSRVCELSSSVRAFMSAPDLRSLNQVLHYQHSFILQYEWLVDLF